jgi:hypothetical protein
MTVKNHYKNTGKGEVSSATDLRLHFGDFLITLFIHKMTGASVGRETHAAVVSGAKTDSIATKQTVLLILMHFIFIYIQQINQELSHCLPIRLQTFVTFPRFMRIRGITEM